MTLTKEELWTAKQASEAAARSYSACVTEIAVVLKEMLPESFQDRERLDEAIVQVFRIYFAGFLDGANWSLGEVGGGQREN